METLHRAPRSSSGALPATPHEDALQRFLADGQTAMRWLLTALTLDRRAHRGSEARAAAVRRLCAELSAHLHVEEELLHPRLRDVLQDPAALDRAEVVRDLLRDQLQRLAEAGPGEPLFAARVQVLGDWLDCELGREQAQLHALLPRLPLDRRALADEMRRRLDALLTQAAQGHGPRFENEEADPVGLPPQ